MLKREGSKKETTENNKMIEISRGREGETGQEIRAQGGLRVVCCC